MPRPTIIASCGALALGGALLAGCGGKDKDKVSTLPVTPAASTSTPAGTPAATGAVTVVMQNNLFAPEKISVKVGQKIRWVNNDPYPHNVTVVNGEKFKSGNLNGGKTFDYTPKKSGTINYICTIHSGQKGSIKVTR